MECHHISHFIQNLCPSDWQLSCTPTLPDGKASTAHGHRLVRRHPGSCLHPAAEPWRPGKAGPGSSRPAGHLGLHGETAAGERTAGRQSAGGDICHRAEPHEGGDPVRAEEVGGLPEEDPIVAVALLGLTHSGAPTPDCPSPTLLTWSPLNSASCKSCRPPRLPASSPDSHGHLPAAGSLWGEPAGGAVGSPGGHLVLAALLFTGTQGPADLPEEATRGTHLPLSPAAAAALL